MYKYIDSEAHKMHPWLKNINRTALREEARRLGVNLITASFVGGFVTHLADLNIMGLVILIWLFMIGLITTLFGLYEVRKE